MCGCRFAGITVDIEANRCLSRQNISDNGDIFSFRQQKVFASCSTCAGLPVVRIFINRGSLIAIVYVKHSKQSENIRDKNRLID